MDPTAYCLMPSYSICAVSFALLLPLHTSIILSGHANICYDRSPSRRSHKSVCVICSWLWSRYDVKQPPWQHLDSFAYTFSCLVIFANLRAVSEIIHISLGNYTGNYMTSVSDDKVNTIDLRSFLACGHRLFSPVCAISDVR